MTEPNAYDDTDLLNYAIQTGIITLDTMLNDIADMERKEILAQHVYAITEQQTNREKKFIPRIFHNKTETDFTDAEIPVKN